MPPIIKHVAIAGISGNVGSHALQELLKQGSFHITALARRQPATIPAGVALKVVDFDSIDALTAALDGQDAFIDATNTRDASLSIRMIDAAVAAGVYRLIPPEFCGDPGLAAARALPPFQAKSTIFEYVEKMGRENKITWTAISNSAFLDWGLRSGFLGIDLFNKKIELFNGGMVPYPSTLLSSVGQAITAALQNPVETENRVCYVHNAWKNQKALADLAQDALGGTWQIQARDMDKAFSDAMGQLENGQSTSQTMVDIIKYHISTPSLEQTMGQNDNELLGVRVLSDDALKDLFRQIASDKGK
ncbi:hypothetical protein BDV40DRAFT_308079 [Aspergillus tamarii]|uniref:NAD(P)-binding domain-containing protein n=1 Tax=Aspergillus tamarii TaxID=41984 RepID=A0A5N6V846_ASPTM|nr:hypothetical protein BDV40DRAFT_308079 [Aspergillus tamarii]